MISTWISFFCNFESVSWEGNSVSFSAFSFFLYIYFRSNWITLGNRVDACRLIWSKFIFFRVSWIDGYLLVYWMHVNLIWSHFLSLILSSKCLCRITWSWLMHLCICLIDFWMCNCGILNHFKLCDWLYLKLQFIWEIEWFQAVLLVWCFVIIQVLAMWSFINNIVSYGDPSFWLVCLYCV